MWTLTANKVKFIHAAWMGVGFGGLPMIFALLHPPLIFMPLLVQSSTNIIWRNHPRSFCPLRLLEIALEKNQPINPWWIWQPILSIIISTAFLEIIWMFIP